MRSALRNLVRTAAPPSRWANAHGRSLGGRSVLPAHAVVLNYFEHKLNTRFGAIAVHLPLYLPGTHETRRSARIMPLAGSDLIAAVFEHLYRIVGRYGVLIMERAGADVGTFVHGHRNIHLIHFLVQNGILSPELCAFLAPRP